MPGIITFEDFELDELRFELRRGGELVHVQPKVLRLLFYLAQHRQRSVSTQELLDALWPAERVTVASIKRAIGGARRVLGESAQSQASIRTVRGHGYQFVRRVVEAVAITPTAPAREDAAASEPSSGAFVGRAQLLAQLEAQLERASAGHGQLVLVSGEPGIGKTWLLQELRSRAAASGVPAWLGRCTHDEGAPALWPVVQLLRAATAELGPDAVLAAMGPGAADIAAALPELRSLYPQLSAPPAIDSTAERFRFFDSLLSALERLARSRGLCLLIDDVQHADALSLALLAFIAQQLDRCHLLVVVSARPVPNAAAPLSKLLQLSTLNSVELTGLGADEVAAWLTRHRGRPAAAKHVSHLHEQTGGNPLFIERMLHSGERVEPAGSPQCLQLAIEQHLDQLTSDGRRALQVAAVLGRELALAVLAEMLETASTELAQRLAPAVGAGLLQAQPGGYSFAHALIRDALYAQLPAAERARLHERAALALEARSHAGDARLAQIADHRLRAAPHHDQARALASAQQAAQVALQRAAFEEAASLFERARNLLEHGSSPDPARQLELLLEQGEAVAQAGDAPAARGLLLGAATRARELGAREVAVRAAMALAQLPETGSLDEARVGAVQHALEACAAGDPRRACLEALHAKTLLYSRDRVTCTRIARSALSDVACILDPALRARALIACWHGLSEPDCLPERKQIAETLARIGHAHSDYRALTWSAVARVSAAMELGDLATVDAGIASLTTLAERVRDPSARWYALTFRAMRCTLAAQLPEAERWAEAAYQLGVSLGPSGARHVYCTQLAALRRLQGRLSEAEQLVRELCLSHPSIAGWQAVLASLEAEQGQMEQPRKVLERMIERDLAALRRDPYALSVIAATSDLCLQVGDATHARPIYEALRAYETRHGSISVGVASHGPLARHLGRLALQLHDFGLAERHFQSALSASEAMPSPLFVSLTLLAYAHLLIVTRAGGGERAGNMLQRATELGRKHELQAVLRYAHALDTLARQGSAIAATRTR